MQLLSSPSSSTNTPLLFYSKASSTRSLLGSLKLSRDSQHPDHSARSTNSFRVRAFSAASSTCLRIPGVSQREATSAAMFVRRLTARLSQPLARTSAFTSQSRALTYSPARRAAASHDDHHGGHDSHYDPPGGWLWGERPGDKYEKEGWENLFYWGFCGSWVVAIIAYAMKEDTSIQTWALEEARRRLEKEGILEDSAK